MNDNNLSFSNLSVAYISFAGALANDQVSGTPVGTSSKIRNLERIFNHTLSMQTHVNAIAKVCYHYLRNIVRVRRRFSDGTVRSLSIPCDFKVGLL